MKITIKDQQKEVLMTSLTPGQGFVYGGRHYLVLHNLKEDAYVHTILLQEEPTYLRFFRESFSETLVIPTEVNMEVVV